MLIRFYNRTLIDITCIASILSLSWYYLFQMPMLMTNNWHFYQIGALFLMWLIMMIAMMLPSTIPLLSLLLKINIQRKQRHENPYSILLFLSGYLFIWLSYSIVITVVQWQLHELNLLNNMMYLMNNKVTAGLLIVTGLYQWSQLKQYCLTQCSSPLHFIMKYWKEGNAGAFLMGICHGQLCVGCCALLMTLLFIFGVMNMGWVLILSIYVLLEKIIPFSQYFSRIIGIILILYGLYLI